MIHNPEYYRMLGVYKLPVFFKSYSKGFYNQGFVDNGREKVQLKSDT